jgi:hypothetical protein
MVNRLQNILGNVEETTKYTEHYEVGAIGDTYIVELSTALAIERQLDQPGEPGWIEFRDVFGARHRTKAQDIYRITESTAETRAALREFRRARRNEDKMGKTRLTGASNSTSGGWRWIGRRQPLRTTTSKQHYEIPMTENISGVFGTHDEKTLEQLREVGSRAERVALMADGHVGYVMLIGGVAPYDNHASVVGVGFDIACGNAAIRTNLTIDAFDRPMLEHVASEI